MRARAKRTTGLEPATFGLGSLAGGDDERRLGTTEPA
jgi:hypothetical protein